MQAIKNYFYEQRFAFAKFVCALACVGVLYSVYLWFSYSQPMLREQFDEASQSWVADKAVSFYDAGLRQYRDEQFDQAVKSLTEAFNACHSTEGGIPPDRIQLAAAIKFLHGNALYKTGKLKTAKGLYEESLRLDPSNLDAKNNLELLNSMNGGKGPPDDAPGGAKPNGGPKRGI